MACHAPGQDERISIMRSHMPNECNVIPALIPSDYMETSCASKLRYSLMWMTFVILSDLHVGIHGQIMHQKLLEIPFGTKLMTATNSQDCGKNSLCLRFPTNVLLSSV